MQKLGQHFTIAPPTIRAIMAFSVMAILLIIVGIFQSWSLTATILNLCLISAIMALGVNIQWGYAGLFNGGIVGFAALGGLAPVLISQSPVPGAWAAGGVTMLITLVILGVIIGLIFLIKSQINLRRTRIFCIVLTLIIGFFVMRFFYIQASGAIESVEPAKYGYLGGLGLPVIFSWVVGGLFAAGAAWLVGRVALGLRSDYLAIATLGISEIIIAILKNEEWLTRGVKNVTGLSRPVPLEIELQQNPAFIGWVEKFNGTKLVGLDISSRSEILHQLVVDYASLVVKLSYASLFAAVLIALLILSTAALNSPWGRMMRAIRDNEVAAAAMGKNITARHLQVFILGSCIVGVAGAMLVTLDGQFTPANYHPLRYTFLIWVMVIVGGSGNNLGAVIGGFLVWFVWVEVEPVGLWLTDFGTIWLTDNHPIRLHLLDNAQHMRLFLMGLILLLVMRFSPGGILPEVVRR